MIGYECVCEAGFVGSGVPSYTGEPGCVVGTTAAPTTPPNPCLGNKKYETIINDRIINYALYRTVKIINNVPFDNISLCASLCARKGTFFVKKES